MSAVPQLVTDCTTDAPYGDIERIRTHGSRNGDAYSINRIEWQVGLMRQFTKLDSEPNPSPSSVSERVIVAWEWDDSQNYKSITLGGSAFRGLGHAPDGTESFEVTSVETLLALYDGLGDVLRRVIELGVHDMPVDQSEAADRCYARRHADSAVPDTVTKPADADGRKRTKRAPKPLRRKAVR